MPYSSNSSSEGVILEPLAKKQISPCIRWTFTLNNWTDEEFEKISSIVPKYCRFAIIGSEIGEVCKTPHLQGYIEFTTKRRPKSIFDCSRIHWEKAKGDQASNIRYCSKDQNVVLRHPPIETIKTISLDIMKSWQLELLDEIKNEPDDRTIHWLWSEHGGVGKTSFLKYLVVHHNFIVLGGKAADCRNGIVEYNKTNGGKCPKYIGINIPRSFNSEYVSYEAFENIKDMLFYSGKYEGGMICGNCPHLFIFANFEPERENLSEDRWRIKKIW